MKLSKIVDAVNAKSFGETSWTYTDIYPFFQQAISEINGELEAFRHISDAPTISETDEGYDVAEYTMLSDMHINNYIVTYITVAMDNAQLATTSRTQTYSAQLNRYKQQLISDLYKWMPIRTQSNLYFDLESGPHPQIKDIPNVGKVWYDESTYGKLSCNESSTGLRMKVPSYGVKSENPYGYLEPEDPNEEIKEGLNHYTYKFTPFDGFIDYYKPRYIQVSIRGYNIPYTEPQVVDVTDVGTISDQSVTLTTQTELFSYMWSVMKDNNGNPADNVPKALTGSYVSGGRTYTFLFTHYEDKLYAISGVKRYVINNLQGDVASTEYLTNDNHVYYSAGKLYYYNGSNGDLTKQEVATLYNINDLQTQINDNETDIENKLQALKDDLSSGTKDVVSNDTLNTYFPSTITYEED